MLTRRRETTLAKALETDLDALARLARHRTRRRDERRRVRVEPRPFTTTRPRGRQSRAVRGPNRDRHPGEGGERRARSRETLEIILDVERVHVRRELLPRIFVHAHGRLVDRAVFAVEEGGGHAHGVGEAERAFDQRDHGLGGW